MSLPPLASIEDVEARMGATLDATRAGSLLDAGSTRIRVFTTRMWVDPDEEVFTDLQLDAVRQVCISYVERNYRNPDGATQQQSGPFNKSVAAWAAGGPPLSDEEKGELRAALGGFAGISTISTTRGYVETPTVDIYRGVQSDETHLP